MFSKRIPVGEKLVGVTGRPRRLLDRSWSSTLSLAQDRAALFPRGRVPAHILPRRWCPLDGAVRAGTSALSAHPGLCRQRHPLRQDSPARSWAPPPHSPHEVRSISISSASRRRFLPPPEPARLPPLPACVPTESHPTQKHKQIRRSTAISKRPAVREPAGYLPRSIHRRPAVRLGPVDPLVDPVPPRHSRPALAPCPTRSRPQACPREHPDARRDSCPVLLRSASIHRH